MTPSTPWFTVGDRAGGSLMATGVRTCDDRDVASTSTSHVRSGPPPAAVAGHPAGPRKFHRRSDGRLIGGVADGLAHHLGLQPLTVRLSFALLAALLALWAAAPLAFAQNDPDDPDDPECGLPLLPPCEDEEPLLFALTETAMMQVYDATTFEHNGTKEGIGISPYLLYTFGE